MYSSTSLRYQSHGRSSRQPRSQCKCSIVQRYRLASRQFPRGVGNGTGIVKVLGDLLAFDMLVILITQIVMCRLDDVDHPMPLWLPDGLVGRRDLVTGSVADLDAQLCRNVDIGYVDLTRRLAGSQ